MATIVIGEGSKGAYLPLLITQGATFGPVVFNAGVDLTGAQIFGQMRKTPSDAAVTSTFTTQILNASAGDALFSMDPVETAKPTAGLLETDATSQYVYDLRIKFANGTIRQYFYGPVSVFRKTSTAP